MSAIGSGKTPIYVGANGDAKASAETIGSNTKPLKMVSGELQEVEKELATKEELTAVNKGTGDVIAKILGIDIKQNNYSLPLATASVRGGAKIGFTKDETNKKYPVELLNEQMFVQVPWQNTVYTLPAATTSTLGGIKTGFTVDTENKKYPVELDDEKAFVQVPWTSSSIPAIDPESIDKIIPLVSDPNGNRMFAPFSGYPKTATNTEVTSSLIPYYALTLLDGFSIDVRRSPYATTTAHYTYCFNMPTWNDGSIRFLFMDVCFSADNASYIETICYLLNNSKIIPIQYSHGHPSGSSGEYRCITHLRVPIKSGAKIYIGTPFDTKGDIAYAADAAYPKIAHFTGCILCI